MRQSVLIGLLLVAVAARGGRTPYAPASQAEVNAGTNNWKGVTPATLAGWTGGGGLFSNQVAQISRQQIGDVFANPTVIWMWGPHTFQTGSNVYYFPQSNDLCVGAIKSMFPWGPATNAAIEQHFLPFFGNYVYSNQLVIDRSWWFKGAGMSSVYLSYGGPAIGTSNSMQAYYASPQAVAGFENNSIICCKSNTVNGVRYAPLFRASDLSFTSLTNFPGVIIGGQVVEREIIHCGILGDTIPDPLNLLENAQTAPAPSSTPPALIGLGQYVYGDDTVKDCWIQNCVFGILAWGNGNVDFEQNNIYNCGQYNNTPGTAYKGSDLAIGGGIGLGAPGTELYSIYVSHNATYKNSCDILNNSWAQGVVEINNTQAILSPGVVVALGRNTTRTRLRDDTVGMLVTFGSVSNNTLVADGGAYSDYGNGTFIGYHAWEGINYTNSTDPPFQSPYYSWNVAGIDPNTDTNHASQLQFGVGYLALMNGCYSGNASGLTNFTGKATNDTVTIYPHITNGLVTWTINP